MPITRGQAWRVMAWRRWLAMTPRERRKVGPPPCVTCGAEARSVTAGEPSYACGNHSPLIVDAETLARIEREFGA